jgi:uncharacterized protein with PIN domain
MNVVPGDAPAFLCDRMLVRLGRWLRAAGYDTAIAEGPAPDRDLIERAVVERRLLITRDRKLTEFREAPKLVIFLEANGVAACAREVTTRLGIDWLRDPFSRCLDCNAPLASASVEQHGRIPERARGLADAATWCAACDKLYWPGSHVRRMRNRLEDWNGRTF